MATLTRPWDRMADQNPFLSFIDTNLRGAGQVMFQNNPLTGLLFLIGIFWGAVAANSIQVGIGALLGLVVSTLTAMALQTDRGALRQGLYGFNGILVGAAVPTFLQADALMWVYIVVGAAVATVVMLAIANVFKTWGVPALTFPFVLTTWFLMLSAYSFARVPIASMGPPAVPQAIDASAAAALTPSLLVSGLFAGISQVFLINNVVTGIIFVIALAVSSRWSAVFALLGALIALISAIVLGADGTSIGAGLFGFSAVLTAIALGSVFYTPSWKVTIYTILGVIFTVIVQGALDTALTPLGIPTFTAPFVFATWLFLLPKESFEPVEHKPIPGGAVGK